MSPKTFLSGAVKSVPRIRAFPLAVLLSVLVLAYFTLTTARSDLSSKTPSISEWISTTPLPEARSDSPTILSDHTIYVLGGRTGGPPDDPEMTNVVYCGTIGPDGNINENGWRTDCERLPRELCDGAVSMAKDDWLCVTGGSINAAPWFSNAAYYGKLEQGRIVRWVTANPTSEQLISRAFHASVESNERIYVIGGWKWENGEQILSSVQYASGEPATNGEVNGWHSATELPEAIEGIYGHAAVEDRGNIYVLGGHNGSTPVNSVYRGIIGGSGETITWTRLVTASLPISLYYHSAVVLNNNICVMGGRYDDDNDSISDKVYRARISEDGNLSGWEEVRSLELPLPLQDHDSVASPDGRIYIIGGVSNYNSYQNSVYYSPLILFNKSADPPGEVHEGDVITYTISYTSTSLITQTITITDPLPFNLTVEPGSIRPADKGRMEGSAVVWDLGDVLFGESGQVSFRARVALLPSLHQESVTALCPTPTPSPPAFVLPVPIACDTTRFWASGVTRQPPVPNPHTIQVQIPPGTSPSEIWLLMKGTDNISPTVGGNPAQLVTTSTNSFGASLWTAPITPTMVASGEVTVITYNPRELNALFLSDENDPPFDEAALDDFLNTTKTFTYTLEMPSVVTQTMDVILPFMDITYWTDDLLPDTRMTEVTVEFDGQSHTVVANDPNLGNGLLMTQFPFTIGFISGTIASKVLTVTVNTEDSVYTLGPRVCRPVYIENTAWLCSQQAGCVSATATNIPEGFMPYGAGGLYLPIILKSYR